jgi:hypothetical protein
MEGLKIFLIEKTPESQNVSHEIHDEDTRKMNQEWRNSNFGLKIDHIPKINMRKFDSKNPITWILQMEKLFDVHDVPHTQKGTNCFFIFRTQSIFVVSMALFSQITRHLDNFHERNDSTL